MYQLPAWVDLEGGSQQSCVRSRAGHVLWPRCVPVPCDDARRRLLPGVHVARDLQEWHQLGDQLHCRDRDGVPPGTRIHLRDAQLCRDLFAVRGWYILGEQHRRGVCGPHQWKLPGGSGLYRRN